MAVTSQLEGSAAGDNLRPWDLEKPSSFAISLGAWSGAMKHTLLATLTALLAVSVTQSSLAEGREKRSGCGSAERCGSNLSQADRENLARAMSRNVLPSIDDRLRRQRYN